MDDLIQVTDRGLYCPKGEFYIDPWRPTDLALITHAHADHARQGAHRYLATRASEPILCHRLGASINLDPVNYGDRFKLGKTWVSFHPAGHVLGSAQIRVEHKDEVWVVSGDYKRASDPTCSPFEVVPCTTFISEATFALPVYRWQAPAEVAQQIYTWWQADLSRPSLLFCYAFGKAQRVLAELMRFTNRPVYLHGAVTRLTQLYREQGVQMLPTHSLNEAERGYDFAGELIIAPPSAHRSPWMKRFKLPQTAFASGWMAVRGNRRRRGYERGFVLSDHIDWTNLIKTIEDTGASRILLTHGQTDAVARYLRDVKGLDAQTLAAPYEGEQEDGSDLAENAEGVAANSESLQVTSHDVDDAKHDADDAKPSPAVAADAEQASSSPKKASSKSKKTSANKTVTKTTSAKKVSAEQAPTGQTSTDKTSTDKTSTDKTSTDRTSTDETSTIKTSAKKTGTQKASAKKTSTKITSAKKTSTKKATSQTTSAKSVSVKRTSDDKKPSAKKASAKTDASGVKRVIVEDSST